MSNQPSLPGFYFDEAKKKYFKIIEGHQSTGTGYTAETVVSKERFSKKERTLLRQRKERIGRLPALQHPTLGRELDGAMYETRHSSIWAAGLHPTRYSGWSGSGMRCLKEVEHFIHDRDTGCLIYDTGHVQYPLLFDNGGVKYGSIDSIWTTGPSSMSLHSSRALLFTTLAGNTTVAHSPSRCYIRFLKRPDNFFHAFSGQQSMDSGLIRYHPAIEDTERPGLDFSSPTPGYLRGETEFLSSAAGPRPERASFVLGTTNGFCFLDERDGDFQFTDWCNPTTSGRPGHKLACSAVDWLNEKTVVVGAVSGKVHLWDRRARKGMNRIRHGSSITHCRKLDDNHIVIAGLINKLHTYDLRFTDPDKSEPYTTYSGYENKGHALLGLDISLNGSIIAAANDSTGMKLFHTATGQEIQIPPDLQSWNPNHGPSRCVKFVDGLQDDQAYTRMRHNMPDNDEFLKIKGPDVGQKLLVAEGKEVVYWGW